MTKHFGDERILRCKACGHVSLVRSLWATEAVPEYYTKAKNYINATESEDRLGLAREAARTIVSFIERYRDTLPNKKWLDVGANYGMLVEESTKKGYDSIGVEPNRELVSRAKRRGVNVIEGTTERLQDEHAGSFGVVSVIDVIEHVPDARTFLNEISHVTANGGLLILELPDIESFLARHHGTEWKYIDREHIHYFSSLTIRKLLSQHNFEVLSVAAHNPFLRLFSIRALLQYYFPTSREGDRLSRPLKGVQNQTADVTERQNKNSVKARSKLLLKKIIIRGLKILKREDFMIVIARKR